MVVKLIRLNGGVILTVKSTLNIEENLKKEEFKSDFESLKEPSFCIALEFIWPRTDEPPSVPFLGEVVRD